MCLKLSAWHSALPCSSILPYTYIPPQVLQGFKKALGWDTDPPLFVSVSQLKFLRFLGLENLKVLGAKIQIATVQLFYYFHLSFWWVITVNKLKWLHFLGNPLSRTHLVLYFIYHTILLLLVTQSHDCWTHFTRASSTLGHVTTWDHLLDNTVGFESAHDSSSAWSWAWVSVSVHWLNTRAPSGQLAKWAKMLWLGIVWMGIYIGKDHEPVWQCEIWVSLQFGRQSWGTSFNNLDA